MRARLTMLVCCSMRAATANCAVRFTLWKILVASLLCCWYCCCDFCCCCKFFAASFVDALIYYDSFQFYVCALCSLSCSLLLLLLRFKSIDIDTLLGCRNQSTLCIGKLLRHFFLFWFCTVLHASSISSDSSADLIFCWIALPLVVVASRKKCNFVIYVEW